jgi:hypothetical protein
LATIEGPAEEEDGAPRPDDEASASASYETPITLKHTDHGYSTHPQSSHKGRHSSASATRACKPHRHDDRQGQVFPISPASYPSPPASPVSTPDGASDLSSFDAYPMRKQHGHPDRRGVADFSQMRFSTEEIGSPGENLRMEHGVVVAGGEIGA